MPDRYSAHNLKMLGENISPLRNQNIARSNEILG
jgi:hypothetical protein